MSYRVSVELRHDSLLSVVKKYKLTEWFPEIKIFVEKLDLAYEQALYCKYSQSLQAEYEIAEVKLFREMRLRLNRLKNSRKIIGDLKTGLAKNTTYIAAINKFALLDKTLPDSYMDSIVYACTKIENNNILQQLIKLYGGEIGITTIFAGIVLGTDITKKLSAFRPPSIANIFRRYYFDKLPSIKLLDQMNPEKTIESISQKTMLTKKSIKELRQLLSQPSTSWAALFINPLKEKCGDILSDSKTLLNALASLFIENIDKVNGVYKNIMKMGDNGEDQIKLAFLFTAKEQQYILQAAAKKNAEISATILEHSPQKIAVVPVPEITKKEQKGRSKTVLISDESSKATIIRMSPSSLGERKLAMHKKNFEMSIKKGAKLFWDIVSNDDDKDIELIITKITHADVIDLLIFIYACSCDSRPDRCCPKECIIDIIEGNRYFNALQQFFLGYQENVKKQQKNWKISPVEKAGTSGANRYNYVISETQCEPDTVVNRFRVFHVRIDTINGKKTIEIKPERYGKSGAYNRFTTKITKTNDDDPLFNKKIIPTELSKTFTDLLKKLNILSPIEEQQGLGAMYTRLLAMSKSKKYAAHKKAISNALKAFEKTAAKESWGHLTERVGKEIILGQEELFVAYFSELNHADMRQAEEWKSACRVLTLFRTLKEKIGLFIQLPLIPNGAEKEVVNTIADFYELVCGKNNIRDTIKDTFTRDYLVSTACLLKKIAPKAQMPTSGKKLQQILCKPVFECAYQLANQ